MRPDQFDRIARLVAREPRVNRRTLAKIGLALTGGGALGVTNLGRAHPALAVCGPTSSNLDCGATTRCCSGICVPRNSSMHCGSCYHSCSMARGEYCVAGTCQGGSSSSAQQGGNQSGQGISEPNTIYESPLGYRLVWHDPTFRSGPLQQGNG